MQISNVDYIIALPCMILSVGALLLLMAEVFLKGKWSREFLSGVFVLIALVSTINFQEYYVEGGTAFSGVIFGDPFSFFVTVLILLGTLLTIFLGMNRMKDEGIESSSEYHSLLLMCSAGALIFATAAELVVLFLGLEIMSMALYCLCGSALRLRRSSESALKYFLLGSFSSAFLLYGIALVYGLTGSTKIGIVSEFLANSNSSVLLSVALGLMLVGFAFKISAVPFHFWAPDVYDGAPTPITAYMSCVIKAAAVAAMLRGIWAMFDQDSLYHVWSGAVWLLAVLSMTLGNLAALRQRKLKRMLAYSSIAHVGYILVAFLAPQFGGGAAIMYYLVSYTAMTLGAFAVLLLVLGHKSTEKDSDDISKFNGLGWRNPMLGVLMTVFMFSLAGLPPGFAGMLGKFYLFNAAVQADYIGLVIIGVINSAISCYYYLRILVAMYFIEAKPGETNPVAVDLALATTIGVCALATVFVGLFPSYLHEMAGWAVTGSGM